MSTTDVEGDWHTIEIYLFSNGQQYSPPRKYNLLADELNWWDATLNNLARAHYGIQHPMIYLYTTDGRMVEGPLELKDGMAYVAVEPDDDFLDTGYEDYLIRASKSWEKRQAKKKIKDESTAESEQNSMSDTEQPGLATSDEPVTRSVLSKAGAAEYLMEDYEPTSGGIQLNNQEFTPGAYRTKPGEYGLAKLGEYGRQQGEYERRSRDYRPKPVETGALLDEVEPRTEEHELRSNSENENPTRLRAHGFRPGGKSGARSGKEDLNPHDNRVRQNGGNLAGKHGTRLNEHGAKSMIDERGAKSSERRTKIGEGGGRPVKQNAKIREYRDSPPKGGVQSVKQKAIPNDNEARVTGYDTRPPEYDVVMGVENPWPVELWPGIDKPEMRPNLSESNFDENVTKMGEDTITLDDHGSRLFKHSPRVTKEEANIDKDGSWANENDPTVMEQGPQLLKRGTKSNDRRLIPDRLGGQANKPVGHEGVSDDYESRPTDYERKLNTHGKRSADYGSTSVDDTVVDKQDATMIERGNKGSESSGRAGNEGRTRDLQGKGEHSGKTSDIGGKVGETRGRVGDRELRRGDHDASAGNRGTKGGDHETRAGNYEVTEAAHEVIIRNPATALAVRASLGPKSGETGARVTPGSKGGETGVLVSPGVRGGEPGARASSRPRASSGARADPGDRVSPAPKSSPGAKTGSRARASVEGKAGVPSAKMGMSRLGVPGTKMNYNETRVGDPETRLNASGTIVGDPGTKEVDAGTREDDAGTRKDDPGTRKGDPGTREDDSVDRVNRPESRWSSGGSGGKGAAPAFPHISEAQQHVKRSSLSSGKQSNEKKRLSSGQKPAVTRKPNINVPLLTPKNTEKHTKKNKESPTRKIVSKGAVKLEKGAMGNNEVEKQTAIPKHPYKQLAPPFIQTPTANFDQTVVKSKSTSLTKITSIHKNLATESTPVGNVNVDKEIIVVSTNLYRDPESDITSIRLNLDGNQVMDDIIDSADETQIENMIIRQNSTSFPVNEEMQTYVEQGNEANEKHGVGVCTDNIRITCSATVLRDNTVTTEDLEENYITIIDKGDVVNLKLNIELRNGVRYNSNHKYCRRSRSLMNIIRTEKGSQISFEEDVQSKSLQSLINNECCRGSGFEGNPKVVVVQCACCGQKPNNPPSSEQTCCNDSKKYFVILPNLQQEDDFMMDDRCSCDPVCQAYSQRARDARKQSSNIAPIKKTYSDISLETITVRESGMNCQKRDMGNYITTTNSSCQTEEQKSECLVTKHKVSITEDPSTRCYFQRESSSQVSVKQDHFIMTKGSVSGVCAQASQQMGQPIISYLSPQFGPLVCSPVCPKPVQAQSQCCSQPSAQIQSQGSLQTSVQEFPQVQSQTNTPECPQVHSQICQSQGVSKTQSQGIQREQSQACVHVGCPNKLPSVSNAQTQTAWCSVLLEARRHEDGRYSFHLPPLEVLRYYTLK